MSSAWITADISNLKIRVNELENQVRELNEAQTNTLAAFELLLMHVPLDGLTKKRIMDTLDPPKVSIGAINIGEAP